MARNHCAILYEDTSSAEFVKEEHNFCDDIGDDADMSGTQLKLENKREQSGVPLKVKEEEDNVEVKPFEHIFISQDNIICVSDMNAVNPLAIKKEDGCDQYACFDAKMGEVNPNEAIYCEVNPYEAIIFNEEEDADVSDFQSNDSDPLAIKEKDGIENAFGFEVKEERKVLLENGDAVSDIHNGNGYSSYFKNGSHLKLREDRIICGSFQESNHKNLASNVTALPESHVNGKSQCRSGDKNNPKMPPTSDKPFQCSDCDFRCFKKTNLKRHMLTHTGDKPFQCSHCEYRCSREGNLERHMLTHTGDKPFQCSHCEYRCSHKGSLNQHMLTHTGDKRFQCSYCEYKCSQKGNLERHIITHTGDKPFQCSFCEFRCSRKGSLNGHMLTHTGDKPFQCSYCEYRCSLKWRLKKHMLTHSGDRSF